MCLYCRPKSLKTHPSIQATVHTGLSAFRNPELPVALNRVTANSQANLFHFDDYLTPGVAFLRVTDRRWNLAQRVTPVNHRGDVTARHEIGEGVKVILTHLRQ